MKNLMNKKTIGIFVITVGVFILLLGTTLAFGVSSQYWKDYPLKMYSGETKDVYVVLQNRAGATEDITATGTIAEGADIAKLIGLKKQYTVPADDEVKVNIRVSIPDDVEVGHEYDIIINFNFNSESEGESLSIGSNVEQILPVLIIEKPSQAVEQEKETSWMYLILGIVVVTILVLLIIRASKKNKKGNNKSKK